MKEFLSSYPLYKEFLIVEDYKLGNEHYYDPSQFQNLKFKHYCEIDGEDTIFNLLLEKDNHFSRYEYSGQLPEFLFQDHKLNFTFLAIGQCQSCQSFKIYFLLNVYSDNPISDILNNTRNITLTEQSSIPLSKSNIYILKKLEDTQKLKLL